MKGFFVKFKGPTGIPEVYATFFTEDEALDCKDALNEEYPKINHWVEEIDFND